jgi:hypothetical protein
LSENTVGVDRELLLIFTVTCGKMFFGQPLKGLAIFVVPLPPVETGGYSQETPTGLFLFTHLIRVNKNVRERLQNFLLIVGVITYQSDQRQ